jgi:Flp pilus assembly protein TadG
MKMQNVLKGMRREIALRGKTMAKRSAMELNMVGGCRKCLRDERGTSLVEAACVFPLFMLLVVGIFSFALIFYNQLTLTQAVGASGQYLQQNRLNQSLTDPCKSALTVLESSAPSLNSSNITLSLNINGTVAAGTAGNASCSGDLSTYQNAQGAPVTVSATYPCSLQALNGMLRMLKAALGSNCTLSAQVTEYEY